MEEAQSWIPYSTLCIQQLSVIVTMSKEARCCCRWCCERGELRSMLWLQRQGQVIYPSITKARTVLYIS